MRGHPIVQLTLARTRELMREPEAVFWIFLFPLLFALALAIAFRAEPPAPIPIGVLDPASDPSPVAEAVRARLDADDEIDARLVDEPAARLALRSGALALVVRSIEPLEVWLDPARPDSREARLAVELALTAPASETGDGTLIRALDERGARYIDFFLPGLLGMNLMGTGLWAIGFALVQQRSGGLLKRFVAAPMRRWHFLVAQILSRLLFLGAETIALLAFGRFLLGVPVHGSLLLLAAVTVLGAMTFVGIGLLVAARPRTIEGVSGLMNLVMVPMWLGSGIFFSTERFPDAMQPVIQALPLTALIDALRAVMLDGAGVTAIAGEAAILALWAVVSFFAALRFFRWQ